jgi:hypothetical protein
MSHVATTHLFLRSHDWKFGPAENILEHILLTRLPKYWVGTEVLHTTLNFSHRRTHTNFSTFQAIQILTVIVKKLM